MCILCVRVKINKCSFEPFCVLNYLLVFIHYITPITRHCHANNLPSTEQATKLNQNKKSF